VGVDEEGTTVETGEEERDQAGREEHVTLDTVGSPPIQQAANEHRQVATRTGVAVVAGGQHVDDHPTLAKGVDSAPHERPGGRAVDRRVQARDEEQARRPRLVLDWRASFDR
jgi:hypothetical protein